MQKMLLVLALALSLETGARAADPPADAPAVTLLSDGQAPKVQLRYHPKVGLRQNLVMSMKMAMAVQVGANKTPAQNLPEMRMPAVMKVTEVTPSGDIRYEFAFRKPEVVASKDSPRAAVDAMKQAIGQMQGITGFGVVTNRGFTTEADYKVPAGVDPQLKQMLDGIKQSLRQMAAPLPDEPVGPGAKWQTVAHIVQNGVAITQTSVNELVSMSGNTCKLRITLEQNAEKQKITQQGVTIDLVSLHSTGSGATTFLLTNIVPTLASVALRSQSKMEAMGQAMEMTLDLAVDMKGK